MRLLFHCDRAISERLEGKHNQGSQNISDLPIAEQEPDIRNPRLASRFHMYPVVLTLILKKLAFHGVFDRLF